VLLQLHAGATSVVPQCLRFTSPSVAVPAQVSVLAADASSVATATTLFTEINGRLQLLAGTGSSCCGPGGLGCMAWEETACEHVLCIVIGQAPAAPNLEQLTVDWLKERPGHASVVPVLVSGITHEQAIGGGGFPTLSQCNALSTGVSVAGVADAVLALALVDERPGVFVSYLRKEASCGAESIFDGLTRAGFRVFLDRFSGTPGRPFPHELSEAMSGLGLVLLLETPSLLKSKWTMWEAAFARRYRIGPLAVNFRSASRLRGVSHRHLSIEDPASSLSQAEVDAIVDFVRRHATSIAIGRRTYYETLVELAAQSRGGSVIRLGAGVLEVRGATGTAQARVLATGAPAQIRHMRRLNATTTGIPALLAGEHHHLTRTAYADLKWLAAILSLEPTGSASVYRRVRQLI
jgi:TIR domain-containing protein